MKFPFSIAFNDRPKFFKSPFKYVIWSFFGNVEDGPIGHQLKSDGTPYTPWEWWLRNPFHNFCFHTIAIPFQKSTVLFGTPEYPDAAFGPKGNGVVLAINGGPFFSFRWNEWNGYLGWRPRKPNAVFGAAFRK